MTLTELWLALLLAFSNGSACDVGATITDWYAYWPAHEYVAVWSLQFDTGDQRQLIHLFEDNDGEQYVFFYNPVDYPHGLCAVVLPEDWRYVHD